MAGLENLVGAVDGVALGAPATLADFIKSVDEELEEEEGGFLFVLWLLGCQLLV